MLHYNIAIQQCSCHPAIDNIFYNCWHHFNWTKQHKVIFEIRADDPSQYHIKVNSTAVIIIKVNSTTVNIITVKSTTVNTLTVKIVTVDTITVNIIPVKCTTTTAGYLGSGLELCQPKLFQPCHSSLLHCHTFIFCSAEEHFVQPLSYSYFVHCSLSYSYFVQQKNILFNTLSYSHIMFNRRIFCLLIFCSLLHSYFVHCHITLIFCST